MSEVDDAVKRLASLPPGGLTDRDAHLEVERLREALHKIAYMDDFMSKETAIEMMHIARNALTVSK